MNEVIALENEDITRELFERAQFVFFAAAGAMGEGGAVRIVTDDGTTYSCNYVYGNADIDRILEACPMMQDIDELPEGWMFRYLGGGNHLLLRREYSEKYLELLGDKADTPGKEYQSWNDVAVKLCSK